MQTREQILDKVAEMSRNLQEKLSIEVQRLLSTGAVNLDDADDNYRLPKALYVVALRNIAEGYSPLPSDRRGKRNLANLSRH